MYLAHYSTFFIPLFTCALVPSFFMASIKPYQAFVVVPVADLVGEPLSQSLHSYKTLPLCGGILNPYLACPRMHQLLFNERVYVLEERGDELLVEIPNVFYITIHDKKTPRTRYWTHKKNILALHNLATKINPVPIPPAISTTLSAAAQNSVITLIEPWYAQELNLLFSAGTRFMCTPHQKKSSSHHIVYAFNTRSLNFEEITIPKNICFRQDPFKKPAKKIRDFIKILRSWTETNDGLILYVWGGCSFTQRSLNPLINEQHTMHFKEPASFYVSNTAPESPKTGFDCSGLIVRAAQIAGLPYFYKNTTTISEYISLLTKQSTLSEGDLIIIPGHVMVVSSLTNNTLIEARSYSHGYGKIQEIPLPQVFKGINTYDDLLDAYYQGKTIYRINNKGIIQDSIEQWSILSLETIFQI